MLHQSMPDTDRISQSDSAGKDLSGKRLNGSRDLSLDFLKGVAIVMVIFFHNLQLNPDSALDNLFMICGNIAIPVFFLVSGALFFTRPFAWNRHIRHIAGFYLGMAAWKAVYLVIYSFLGIPFPVSKRELLSYLFFFGTINGIATGHLWFIAAMMTVLLIAPVLKNCMEQDRKLAVYLMVICFIFNQLLADLNLLDATLARLIGKDAWGGIPAFGEINPLSFRHSNYILYYMLGAFLREQRAKKEIPLKVSGTMMIMGITGLVLIKYLQSGTFLWRGIHLSSGSYWSSTILAASGAFLLAARLPINRSKWMKGFSQTVGTATLGIFYLHMPLIHILTPVLFVKLTAYNGWLLNLMESLLIAAISCILVLGGRKLSAQIVR